MARAILSIIMSTRAFVPLNLASMKGMLQAEAQDMRYEASGCAGSRRKRG
mgnify:CR=1 FL=1